MDDKPATLRRTDLQITRDMEEATILSLQGYTTAQIVQMMNERDCEYAITTSMVSNDLQRAAASMAESFIERAQAALALELKRLDVAEDLAWREFRKLTNMGSELEEVISEANENGEMVETMRRRVRQYSPYALGWFNKILDIQKERRRVLGMYAPKHLKITEEKKVVAKAYLSFNPGKDWPEAPDNDDILEGMIVD